MQINKVCNKLINYIAIYTPIIYTVLATATTVMGLVTSLNMFS